MKKQLLGLVIIMMFNGNIMAQFKNSFYTHVSDSAGYQSYYAIEILKKGKPIKQHYREAMYVKFNLKTKTIKGRWYFKSNPDSIIIKQDNVVEDLPVSLNALTTITFKLTDNYTIVQVGAAVVVTAVLLTGGLATGALIGGSNNWGTTYPLFNEKCTARVVIKKETEKEKLLREKTEKSNQERFERQQKRKAN